MSLFKDLLESGLAVSIIVIGVIALVTIIPLLIGLVCYWLLSIAFPEFIIFGWHWWRFLALGIIVEVFM